LFSDHRFPVRIFADLNKTKRTIREPFAIRISFNPRWSGSHPERTIFANGYRVARGGYGVQPFRVRSQRIIPIRKPAKAVKERMLANAKNDLAGIIRKSSHPKLAIREQKAKAAETLRLRDQRRRTRNYRSAVIRFGGRKKFPGAMI